jgi:hypothetical protein
MRLVGGKMKHFSCHLFEPLESFEPLGSFEPRDLSFEVRDIVAAVSQRTDFRSIQVSGFILQVYAWPLIPPRSIG